MADDPSGELHEPAVQPVSCDLAPGIHRQRLVVEGLRESPISAEEIRLYLSELSDVLEMKLLLDPVTHRSDTYGWAGWVH